MKTAMITCPNCHWQDALPLDTQSIPLVLSCPHCNASFMCFSEATYTLDQKRMKELFNAGDPGKLKEYMWDIINGPVHREFHANMHENFISKDSILDLVILLNTCNSVEDFLNRI